MQNKWQMFRGLIVVALLLAIPRADAGQSTSVLHITVVLQDPQQNLTPVPRHALLISDNPSTAPPRRIFTSADGSVDVKLRPGNYTVESDRPVAFAGNAYQWTQIIDIVAGRDAMLALTTANAEIEAASSETTAAAPVEDHPSSLLTRWQDGVVAVWSPTAHATGFLIDASGLIATSQRAVGDATSVEVQLSPSVKVAAPVLVSDQARDVAILRIDAATMASASPLPLVCAAPTPPSVVDGDEIFVVEAPLREQKGTTSGIVSRVAVSVIESDLRLATGGAGGPAFASNGTLLGITSIVDANGDQRRLTARVIRMSEMCAVVASAQKKMKEGVAPNATHLPVEPVRPYPVNALEDLTQYRAGSLSPYRTSSSDFDIAFITPVQLRAAQDRDFGNWSEYVESFPAVLLVRVTPKLVEGFWTKVARGAASTQGVSLPPIKRLKSGFARMRAFCGDAEITPIHPFTIERRVSETDAIDEGLYVFNPEALGPTCTTVRLLLYSEKEPEQPDTVVVDAKVVQQMWQDFAPHRALK